MSPDLNRYASPQALRADQMTRLIEANPLIQQAIIGLLVALVLAMWGP